MIQVQLVQIVTEEDMKNVLLVVEMVIMNVVCVLEEDIKIASIATVKEKQNVTNVMDMGN